MDSGEPKDPFDAFLTDDESASFFEGEGEKIRQEIERERVLAHHDLELEVDSMVATTIELFRYSPLEKGTVRYDEMRAQLRAAVESKVVIDSPHNAERDFQAVEEQLDVEMMRAGFAEELALDQAKLILKAAIARQRGNLTTDDVHFIASHKRQLFARALISYNIPRQSPIYAIINYLIPGERIDFEMPIMAEHYINEHENLANETTRRQRSDAFNIGLNAVLDSSDDLSDEDIDRARIAQHVFVEDAKKILEHDSLTEAEKNQKLHELSKSSVLNPELAQATLTYLKENKHLLD